MKIFICNKMSNFFCIYSKEINEYFNKSEYVTHNIQDANYLITCLSDERNYPIFGNMKFANPKNKINNLNLFLTKYFKLNNFQKIVIFYHTPKIFLNNVITICYSKDNNDNNNIVICPPAIKKYSFNNNINKPILLSFKGFVNRSKNRINIFNNFKKYSNDKIIIVDKKNDEYDYDYLMLNSLFSLIIEGDLPWSYRFTEAINAGSIPIIIKPKNKNILGFSDLIDYSLFSFVISQDEIDNFMVNIFNKLSIDKINDMLANLQIVNNKYFLNRQTQVNGVIEILNNKLLKKI